MASSTIASWMEDSAVASQYAYYLQRWKEEAVPSIIEFWVRLEVAPWNEYRAALQAFASDFVQSSKSTMQLLFLTFRPLAILIWIILQLLWAVGKVLFKLLLEKGWISLQKGAVQAKHGAIWFYHFQRGLSRTEVMGECALLAAVVALYYLRKWLKRQTYFARAMRWYRTKKRRFVQSYKKVVHRVAQVSRVLALTMPHLAFVSCSLALKLLFPSVFRWLASETYFTELISVAYPLIGTLAWIHECRHGWGGEQDNGLSHGLSIASSSSTVGVVNVKKAAARLESKANNNSPTKAKNSKTPSYMRPTAASQHMRQRKRGVSTDGDSPSKIKPSSSSSPKSVTSEESFEASVQSAPTVHPEAYTKYWLRYWGLYALVQCIGKCCAMVPIFGRFVARHPFVMSLSAELKLLFFVWLFVMERLLGATADDDFLAEAMPLRLIHKQITPILLELEALVSEPVSKETWKRMVFSKVQGLLQAFTFVKLIKEPTKDWLLHVLEESRTLLLPSITLLMPGFITQFGVAYVQYAVPAIRSSAHAQQRKYRQSSQEQQLLYLQYWVLHSLLTGLLHWLSGILWWIPFSTHLIFLVWCHLSFPQTIIDYYDVLEMELIAFGLLKAGDGDAVMELHETRSFQVISYITQRLPSAADDDEWPSIFKQPSTLSKQPSIMEQPSTIEHSISADTERVEVSLPKGQAEETHTTEKEQLADKEDNPANNDEDVDRIPDLAKNHTISTNDVDDNSDDSSSLENNQTSSNTKSKIPVRRSTRNRKQVKQ